MQGRIENWHIRPSILWVVLPLAYQLLMHEPWMFGVISLVAFIPFACVFMAWCARYGVENTFCMGWQYLQRCFTLEGVFSHRIVAMTKRYIYDFDALYNPDDDEESQEKTEDPVAIKEQHSPEDLVRIRANTAKHLRSYIGTLIFVLLWGVWLIFSSPQMVANHEQDFDLDMRPPTRDGYYVPAVASSQAYAQRTHGFPRMTNTQHTHDFPQMINTLISPRKEIVTFTIQKEVGVKLGISATTNGFGKLTVTRVDKTGLLAGTELKEGMELLGINGIDVSRMSISEAAEIVKEAKGIIEIIAPKDRDARDKDLVTATLREGDVDRLGLQMFPDRDGKYIIGKILEDGVAAGTSVKLNQGMEVFSINGVLVTGLSHREVLELMHYRGTTNIKAWKLKIIDPVTAYFEEIMRSDSLRDTW